MVVVKRDGREVEFDKERIVMAIQKAIVDVEHLVEEAADEAEYPFVIANFLEEELQQKTDVETIQDKVELLLMDFEPVVAKAYILYRFQQSIERKEPNKDRLLTDDFISKYKKISPPMGELGNFVYYRTYSRWLPEERRREYWWETVRRSVEFNASLAPTTRDEAEKLFHNIFHLKQFLSGRTLFTGGTEVSKKYGLANFNCFKKDTKFITSKGIKSFEDFEDEDKVEVLNANGGWSEATIKNFGKDNIVQLVIAKHGTTVKEVIETTAGHQWFVRKTKGRKEYVVKRTDELKPGQIFRNARRYTHQTPSMCNVGLMHGIVFGDGSYDKKKNHCRVSLIGKKQDLLEYFTTGQRCTEGKRDSTLVYGLPCNWKSLPSVNTNIEYINGFLYGLMLTDGSSYGSMRLSQSNPENLQHIRSLFSLIGVVTSNLKENERKNSNLGNYSNSYSINIYRDTIPKNWTVFSEKESNETLWKVEEVIYTEKQEDVYCVIEPKTHAFTLANGILTHNCSYTIADDFESFKDLFYLLLIGAGVGLGIRKNDVAKLPRVRGDIKLINKAYAPVKKEDRIEYTSLEFEDNIVEVVVGDSKEAFTQSLEYFLRIYFDSGFSKVDTIIMNYDNVRPEGERLKTFGGFASGHTPLMSMFDKIHEVLIKENDGKKKLKPIDCLDIANIIGISVVSGGVRRTSEVMLFDADDEEVKNCKSNLYKQIDGEWKIDEKISHRRMSNNSIQYEQKPTKEEWHEHVKAMRFSGEPAFQNLEAARKRRADAQGGNPLTNMRI